MESLRDKIVCITGASAGIGEACAEAFAHEGCALFLSARRKARVDGLAARLREQHGVRTLTAALDVTRPGDVQTVFSGLTPEWRDIDILVNNAGLSRGLGGVQDGSLQDWEEMIDTNVKGLLWVSRAVLPGMVARDCGQIINIGSVAGHQVYQSGNVYCATKYAVRALTQGLRLDLLGTRVRCSTVDPGMVQTEFSEVRFHGDQERAAKVYLNFPPLQPADVAETILFCATRPPHVVVQEILLMPQDQGAVYASHPRGVGG
jgi:serine 3-dehydrogenase